MIDPLDRKLTELYDDAMSTMNGGDMAALIAAVSDVLSRVVELERKVRSQSATINELVGRANE